MKTVIKNGYTIKIDNQDYELISNIKFHVRKNNKGFLSVRLSNMKHFASIFFPEYKTGVGLEIDHINGDPLDNRRKNLRICTHAENMRNRKIFKNNTSGFKGVSWCKETNKWCAKCYLKRKATKAWFKNIYDAAEFYNKTALALHGKFARLNIIPTRSTKEPDPKVQL